MKGREEGKGKAFIPTSYFSIDKNKTIEYCLCRETKTGTHAHTHTRARTHTHTHTHTCTHTRIHTQNNKWKNIIRHSKINGERERGNKKKIIHKTLIQNDDEFFLSLEDKQTLKKYINTQ